MKLKGDADVKKMDVINNIVDILLAIALTISTWYGKVGNIGKVEFIEIYTAGGICATLIALIIIRYNKNKRGTVGEKLGDDENEIKRDYREDR